MNVLLKVWMVLCLLAIATVLVSVAQDIHTIAESMR